MSQIGTFLLVTVFTALLPPFGKREDDFYAVLGVSKHATNDEIRKAYKKWSLKLHPDKIAQRTRAPPTEEQRQHYENIQEAYQVLVHENKRQQYDTLKQSPARYRFVAQGGLTNPGALYENLTNASCWDKSRLIVVCGIIGCVLFMQPMLIASKINQLLSNEGPLADTSWTLIFIPFWMFGALFLSGVLFLLIRGFAPTPAAQRSLFIYFVEYLLWYILVIVLCRKWDGHLDDTPYRTVLIPLYLALAARALSRVWFLQQIRHDLERMVTPEYFDQEIVTALEKLQKEEGGNNNEDKNDDEEANNATNAPPEALTEEQKDVLRQQFFVVSVPPGFDPQAYVDANNGEPIEAAVLEELKVQSSPEYNAAVDLYHSTMGKLVGISIFGIVFVILVVRKLDDNFPDSTTWWAVFSPVWIYYITHLLYSCSNCLCASVRGDEIILMRHHPNNEKDGDNDGDDDDNNKDPNEESTEESKMDEEKHRRHRGLHLPGKGKSQKESFKRPTDSMFVDPTASVGKWYKRPSGADGDSEKRPSEKQMAEMDLTALDGDGDGDGGSEIFAKTSGTKKPIFSPISEESAREVVKNRSMNSRDMKKADAEEETNVVDDDGEPTKEKSKKDKKKKKKKKKGEEEASETNDDGDDDNKSKTKDGDDKDKNEEEKQPDEKKEGEEFSEEQYFANNKADFEDFESAYQEMEEGVMQRQAQASMDCCWTTLKIILVCMVVAKLEKATTYDIDDEETDNDNPGFNTYWILFPFFLAFGCVICCCACLVYGAAPGTAADLHGGVGDATKPSDDGDVEQGDGSPIIIMEPPSGSSLQPVGATTTAPESNDGTENKSTEESNDAKKPKSKKKKKKSKDDIENDASSSPGDGEEDSDKKEEPEAQGFGSSPSKELHHNQSSMEDLD